MAHPLIALLTDFGLRDHYVGTMKGVAAGICPDAAFIDLTHEIPPHDVADAARLLAASFRDFPAGTVFLVVVDPGVGSGRRGLAAEAGPYRFVAPDNGVLSEVFSIYPLHTIVELTKRRYFRTAVSRTFEGRDRFAPVAAWLARGTPVSAVGRPLADPVLLDLPRPAIRGEALVGAVVQVDRFGNLITNIDRRSLGRFAGEGPVTVVVGDRPPARLVGTYAEIGTEELCALIGSGETLEIAAQSASAAAVTGYGRGTPVLVRRV